MCYNFSKRIDEILNVGINLEEYGTSNWGLTKEQSLNVLKKFLKNNIAILGGDIYVEVDEYIKPNYDNWYCERCTYETKLQFVKRSNILAKSYIENYQPPNNTKYYFVLVPDDE